jgi:hypothetical protein
LHPSPPSHSLLARIRAIGFGLALVALAHPTRTIAADTSDEGEEPGVSVELLLTPTVWATLTVTFDDTNPNFSGFSTTSIDDEMTITGSGIPASAVRGAATTDVGPVPGGFGIAASGSGSDLGILALALDAAVTGAFGLTEVRFDICPGPPAGTGDGSRAFAVLMTDDDDDPDRVLLEDPIRQACSSRDVAVDPDSEGRFPIAISLGLHLDATFSAANPHVASYTITASAP